MKSLNVFIYEWKHFTNSPFKLVALVLFISAGIYGLYNGQSLYIEQSKEFVKINKKVKSQVKKHSSYYDMQDPSPEDRPWVDLSVPDWAIWYTRTYHFKKPSPAMVYSIGQAEQYGFYKMVTYMSSPYDSDMTKEIANAERLQNSTLDFSFALIFLLPLLLIILLYNLKSMEVEQGFIALIEVQTGSKNIWLLFRSAFYIVLVYIIIVGLILYGSSLTDVISLSASAFNEMLIYSFLYLIFWSTIYYFILINGNSIMGNALKMIAIWILATFIIPASVNQWVSIEKPINLMTDFIDASRDKKEDIYNQTDSVLIASLFNLYPEISNNPIKDDNDKVKYAIRETKVALVNQLKKEYIAKIEDDNMLKNEMIKKTYLFNPVSFFQNHLNTISKTHYYDYQSYRYEIQSSIDKQIKMLVLDTWNDVKVDKERFLNYHKIFSL